FRGVSVDPGTMAVASGALYNPPYNGPDFLVARMALCAHDPGDLVLHWQFYPPAPVFRDTDIVDQDNQRVSDRNCYEDYVIHVVGPALTPTPTLSPTVTPTTTATDTPTEQPPPTEKTQTPPTHHATTQT